MKELKQHIAEEVLLVCALITEEWQEMFSKWYLNYSLIFNYVYVFISAVIGSIFNEDVYAIIIPVKINFKLPEEITSKWHEK